MLPLGLYELVLTFLLWKVMQLAVEFFTLFPEEEYLEEKDGVHEEDGSIPNDHDTSSIQDDLEEVTFSPPTKTCLGHLIRVVAVTEPVLGQTRM